jgi:hypothetical protein
MSRVRISSAAPSSIPRRRPAPVHTGSRATAAAGTSDPRRTRPAGVVHLPGRAFAECAASRVGVGPPRSASRRAVGRSRGTVQGHGSEAAITSTAERNGLEARTESRAHRWPGHGARAPGAAVERSARHSSPERGTRARNAALEPGTGAARTSRRGRPRRAQSVGIGRPASLAASTPGAFAQRFFSNHSALIFVYFSHFSGISFSSKIASTGHSGAQAPQSMHSSGLM